MIPSDNTPFCLELACSVSPAPSKSIPQVVIDYRKGFLFFSKQPFVCVQTSRDPAEDRRVFSESDAPDEVHVCGLLFQPSVCSQCAHTAQVKTNAAGTRDTRNVKKRYREPVWFFQGILICFMCVTVKNWGSTWSQRGHPVQGSWLWPPVWVNPSPDWKDTLHCWKNWTGTCRLSSSHLLPKVLNSQMTIIMTAR